MIVALRIEVATLRGAREGVPQLVDLLRRQGAGATFLFAVGPDHTGRALARLLREGSAGDRRWRSLAYGTLLPAPDIGLRAADVMRATRDAGFETGVLAWNAMRWIGGAAGADEAWTRESLRLACERYTDIFGEPPRAHGAAGWQTNLHALRLTQRLGFDYASDGRGRHPHLPFWNAEPIRCPQFPTTLPTLAELAARTDARADGLAGAMLALTADAVDTGQVATLDAERDGLRLRDAVERLVAGWKAQGRAVASLRRLVETREPHALPRCAVALGRPEGAAGPPVLMQGAPFPGSALPAAA